MKNRTLHLSLPPLITYEFLVSFKKASILSLDYKK